MVMTVGCNCNTSKHILNLIILIPNSRHYVLRSRHFGLLIHCSNSQNLVSCFFLFDCDHDPSMISIRIEVWSLEYLERREPDHHRLTLTRLITMYLSHQVQIYIQQLKRRFKVSFHLIQRWI